MAGPTGLTVDLVNSELIVTLHGGAAVNVYSRTANRNAAPPRTIFGAATGLGGPERIAADLVNNELFVVNNSDSSLTVYARTASGNIAPIRTIVGLATGLNNPRFVAIGAGGSAADTGDPDVHANPNADPDGDPDAHGDADDHPDTSDARRPDEHSDSDSDFDPDADPEPDDHRRRPGRTVCADPRRSRPSRWPSWRLRSRGSAIWC